MPGRAVVVLVLAGQMGPTATRDMKGAAAEALERDSTVTVRTVATLPSRAESEREATRTHADAFVLVQVEGEPPKAHVRMYTVRSSAWSDADVESDQAADREPFPRALGFVIASMVPREVDAPEPAPETPPQTPPELPPKPPPHRAEKLRSFRFDLGGAGAIESTGLAYGFAASATWLPARFFGLRAFGGSRYGHVADASTSVLRLGIGGAWYPVALQHGPWQTGVHFGISALRHGIVRYPGGNRSADYRWLPGVDLAAELAWMPGVIGPYVAAGVDVSLGTTRVFIGDTRAGSLDPFRAAGELGVRLQL